MPAEQSYANTKKAFEELDIGEKISAFELAKRIGATIYKQRKNVAAFLSRQARLGRARKHIGEDGRMYYEKIAPTAKPRPTKPSPARVAPPKERRRELITYGEIGENIVNYIDKLRARISELERENEASKRRYQEAEQKVKELSEKQAAEQRTVRLSKIIQD